MSLNVCVHLSLLQLFERLDVSGDGDVDSNEFLAWYFDVDNSKPAPPAPPPDTRGLLEKEPAVNPVSIRVVARFARFLKKPFARDPAKPDRAKPTQVLPEDYLVRVCDCDVPPCGPLCCAGADRSCGV
jgi:hypothetical protein